MEININDLPKYSNWPHRLLGLSEWVKNCRNESEILREFNHDKWGSLLERVNVSKEHLSFEQFERLVFSELNDLVCLQNQKLIKMSAYDAFKHQYKIILNTILNQMPATLCELGAGYGQVILNIAKEKDFSQVQLIATEYTLNGVKLIEYLTNSLAANIIIGRCDLNSVKITDIQIPVGTTIFTSFAAMYIPKLGEEFIKNISSFKPALIIHFEPIYEHCDTQTLLGSMQKKYIELNDYNQNLLTILKKAENEGIIEIVNEQSQVFGSNPFLPMSLVAWKPKISKIEVKDS